MSGMLLGMNGAELDNAPESLSIIWPWARVAKFPI